MRITEKSSPKLRVALNVLKHIKVPENKVCIKTYSNCREQGFHVIYWDSNCFHKRAVSFSEFRSSDNIVVYAGLDQQFMPCGTPYERYDIWDNRKYFKPEQYEKAGAWITKYLLKEIRKPKQKRKAEVSA